MESTLSICKNNSLHTIFLMSLLLSNFHGHYDFQVITCEISGCFEGSTIVISSCISEMWDILNHFNWSSSGFVIKGLHCI